MFNPRVVQLYLQQENPTPDSSIFQGTHVCLLNGIALQNERAEQLRSLSFLAGILLSFGMAALYQLVFEPDSFAAGTKIFYALTVALTVRLSGLLKTLDVLTPQE